MKNANVDCCFVICFESQNQKYALILPVAEVFEIVWLELIGVHNEKNIGKHCKQKKNQRNVLN